MISTVGRPVERVDQSLTIVIPAYNEEGTVGKVLSDLRDRCPELSTSVIVVDDGSSDRTAEIAGSLGADVLWHPRNLGYGAALKTAVRHAKTPFVLTMDADGQHTSAHLERLWAQRHEADMVVGARAGMWHSRAWRMPGKWLLTTIASYLARQPILLG